MQEERQEKLHGMALWPELQYSGSAWFCNKLFLSYCQLYWGGPKISSFPHWVKFMFLSSLQKFYCGISDCECLSFILVTDLQKRKKPMYSASQEPWACPASLIGFWQGPYSICHAAFGTPCSSLQDSFKRGTFPPQLPSLPC